MMVGEGEARSEGEKNADYVDAQKFLGRDRPVFLHASDRDYRDGGEGFHLEHRMHKDSGGDAGERKTMYGVNQLTAFGFGRDQDQGGRERVGPEADYADMGVVRGEVSEVSQSEGTEEDEDEGDMEGHRGSRGREMGIVERGMPQFESRVRQDSMLPSRSVDGFQRQVSERDRGLKSRTAPPAPYGLHLQPSSQVVGLNFLKYPGSSPSGGQMATHVDTNAGQNGGIGAGAVGASAATSYPGGMSRDAYAKSLAIRENPSGNPLHEQHSHSRGHLQDGLHPAEENYYTSLLNSSGSNVIPHKDPELLNDGQSPGLKRNLRMMETPSLRSILRSILSDPVSGQLMEDATIFACGHSFGNLGLRQVLASSICITCGATVRSTLMAANHALRAAVQAFKREEDNFASPMRHHEENFALSRRDEENFAVPKVVKKRRDRPEQDGRPANQHPSSDGNRAKGVQFPFAVSERVIIRGNKRTPERFVGREAVITNQCLNGWYLVKTLDNGESVRLQYRSLQKIGVQPTSSPPLQT